MQIGMENSEVIPAYVIHKVVHLLSIEKDG